MNNNSNKLYVNPHFIKYLENEVPLSKPMLHINPNFYPKIIKNEFTTNSNVLNTKIYVNPRFVAHAPVTETMRMYDISNNTENSHSDVASYSPQTEKISLPVSSVPKSRYKLVRNEAVITNNKEITPVAKQTSTIVINKYKTASMRVLKENLKHADNIKSTRVSTINIPHNKMQNKPNMNQYKFVRATNSSAQQHKIVNNKIVTQSTKEYLQSTDKLKLMSVENSITLRRIMNRNILLKPKSLKPKRLVEGKFKKNNIPCPLFKKYGKCIRKVHGNCKFIHDKKHVSICKKFLHGLCHDINCLLSHELTAKKMPTCRFYLKGLCARDDCPYVHVKLNEKTSICVDFLKGYCDQGDQCLKRHINMCPRFTITGKCPVLKCPYPHEADKAKNLKSDIKPAVTSHRSQYNNIIEVNEETKKSCDENCRDNTDGNANDKRYYIDNSGIKKTLPESEVIRPSRCKLGTLPSYIKL